MGFRIDIGNGRSIELATAVPHDLLLRELWMRYAEAVGPFDFVAPPAYELTGTSNWPGLQDALGYAHRTLSTLRAEVATIRDHSDYSTCMLHWLRAVDRVQGWHAIRQAFIHRISAATSLPCAALAAEPLMRARVDDAMVRLEGREYDECYTHVLSELRSLLQPHTLLSLASHCRELCK